MNFFLGIWINFQRPILVSEFCQFYLILVSWNMYGNLYHETKFIYLCIFSILQCKWKQHLCIVCVLYTYIQGVLYTGSDTSSWHISYVNKIKLRQCILILIWYYWIPLNFFFFTNFEKSVVLILHYQLRFL